RVAGFGLGHGLEVLDLSAGGVLLDGLRPVPAAKLGLVERLEAGLAEEVVREIALLPQVRKLLRRDRARIAEQLRDERPLRVLAACLDRDFDARQRVAGLRQ